VAVLIPSIDLMGGKIVQLVQGEKKALEFDDFDEWTARFGSFPMVQLIDLDAAMGMGDNRRLITHFVQRLPCQVGGGVRSIERAQQLLEMGARRVILGSALIQDGQVNVCLAEEARRQCGVERLVFALDSRQGRVAIRGWKELTALTPEGMIQSLEPYCSAFLYTHIDTEGLMQGIPVEIVGRLRQVTSRQLIVAGGITTQEEIDRLHSIRIDAVVGMAIYTGRLKLPAASA
jgi:phosphoribosylformimino-5-aminoimidazole carboxamide ribotide isomerase